MTDTTTNKRLRISDDERTGPALVVPLMQLKEVQRLLDSHQIPYWVEETAISLGGRPAMAFVNFGHRTEGKKIQEILDSIP